MAGCEGFENMLAVELARQDAGQAAQGSEFSGTRVRGTGTALVIIGVCTDADPVPAGEGIFNQPLERSPGRMDLDGEFDVRVVDAHVRVAPAHMGEGKRPGDRQRS